MAMYIAKNERTVLIAVYLQNITGRKRQGGNTQQGKQYLFDQRNVEVSWERFIRLHVYKNYSQMYLQFVVLTLVGVIGLTLILTFTGSRGANRRRQLRFLPSVTPSALMDLTNDRRSEQGISELDSNKTLQQAAQKKADHMAENQYFAHDSPSGLTTWSWFRKVDYTYRKAGENLAVNFSDNSQVVDYWMDSSSHRQNILEQDFTEIGVATAEGRYEGDDTVFVVQMFGRPDAKELAKRDYSSQFSFDNQSSSTTQENRSAQETTTGARLSETSTIERVAATGGRQEDKQDTSTERVTEDNQEAFANNDSTTQSVAGQVVSIINNSAGGLNEVVTSGVLDESGKKSYLSASSLARLYILYWYLDDDSRNQ